MFWSIDNLGLGLWYGVLFFGMDGFDCGVCGVLVRVVCEFVVDGFYGGDLIDVEIELECDVVG